MSLCECDGVRHLELLCDNTASGLTAQPALCTACLFSCAVERDDDPDGIVSDDERDD
jgi:hypothetical protein